MSSQHFSNVEVEEIAVQHSLDNTSTDSNGIHMVIFIISVDPVQDVERTVCPKSKQVMAGDVFSFSGLGHHEQLWHNGNRLEIDGKSPEDLEWGELVVENECEDCRRKDGKFNHSKCVMISIVRRLKLLEYRVYSCTRRSDEQNFHCGVVNRDEGEENIQVSGNVYNGKEDLTFARNPSSRSGFPDFGEQQGNRQNVRKIAKKSENIHLELVLWMGWKE